METVQQNGRFTLFSSKFLSIYSILYEFKFVALFHNAGCYLVLKIRSLSESALGDGLRTNIIVDTIDFKLCGLSESSSGDGLRTNIIVDTIIFFHFQFEIPFFNSEQNC